MSLWPKEISLIFLQLSHTFLKKEEPLYSTRDDVGNVLFALVFHYSLKKEDRKSITENILNSPLVFQFVNTEVQSRKIQILYVILNFPDQNFYIFLHSQNILVILYPIPPLFPIYTYKYIDTLMIYTEHYFHDICKYFQNHTVKQKENFHVLRPYDFLHSSRFLVT